jgi:hypothetical protein
LISGYVSEVNLIVFDVPVVPWATPSASSVVAVLCHRI